MALRGRGGSMMKTNKKGQMHTIEALLALMLIIGVVAFTARSAPGETQVEGSMDTQLALYGNDFLSILDMEQPDHKSWLYYFVETNNITGFKQEWEKTNLTDKKGIFYKLELYNGCDLQNFSAPYGEPPENAVTVSRLVTLVNPHVEVYEVRLTLWYV